VKKPARPEYKTPVVEADLAPELLRERNAVVHRRVAEMEAEARRTNTPPLTLAAFKAAVERAFLGDS
jgi:hypothetical protein